LKFQSADGMVRLPGGSFIMGSAAPQASEDDAQPHHRVRLAPFWLDATPVTNRQFQEFVERNDYLTDAERLGSSLVFDRRLASWRDVAGASWRHPAGADSSLVGLEEHPVVQVTWQDAVTYAAWANKRLPTEAEYEYAARGGLGDCIYPWGQDLSPRQPSLAGVQLATGSGANGDGHDRYWANGWQGHFPQQDLGKDGFQGTSPVRHFPPNRFGLYDMAGNAWNWCGDWYAADYYGASLAEQPRGPSHGVERSRRGGSWLSATNYEGDLRVARRGHAPPSEATNHTGFRCARDAR